MWQEHKHFDNYLSKPRMISEHVNGMLSCHFQILNKSLMFLKNNVDYSLVHHSFYYSSQSASGHAQWYTWQLAIWCWWYIWCWQWSNCEVRHLLSQRSRWPIYNGKKRTNTVATVDGKHALMWVCVQCSTCTFLYQIVLCEIETFGKQHFPTTTTINFLNVLINVIRPRICVPLNRCTFALLPVLRLQ